MNHYQMLFDVIRGCAMVCQGPAFPLLRRSHAEELAPTAWNYSDAHGASEEESGRHHQAFAAWLQPPHLPDTVIQHQNCPGNPYSSLF